MFINTCSTHLFVESIFEPCMFRLPTTSPMLQSKLPIISLQGCRIWWSPGDVYLWTGMHLKGYASRWVASLWNSWKKMALAMDLCVDWHLRLSNLSSNPDELHKTLPYASLSTIAFLAVLLRLCSCSRDQGGLAEASSREHVQAVLRQFLTQGLNTKPFALTIGLGCSGKWFPPAQTISSDVPILLHFSENQVTFASNNDAIDFCSSLGLPCKSLFPSWPGDVPPARFLELDVARSLE